MSTSFIFILSTVVLMSTSVNGEPKGKGILDLVIRHGPEVVDLVTGAISNIPPGTESPRLQQYVAVNNDYGYKEEQELPLLRNLGDGCFTICGKKGGLCHHCGKIGLCCRLNFIEPNCNGRVGGISGHKCTAGYLGPESVLQVEYGRENQDRLEGELNKQEVHLDYQHDMILDLTKHMNFTQQSLTRYIEHVSMMEGRIRQLENFVIQSHGQVGVARAPVQRQQERKPAKVANKDNTTGNA